MAEEKIAEYAFENSDANFLYGVSDLNFLAAQGFQHSLGVDVTITRLLVKLKQVGSISAGRNTTAELWDSNTPGSSHIIGVASAPKEARTISSSYVTIEFTWAAGPSLSSATQYWFVLAGDWDRNATDYLSTGRDNSSSYGHGMCHRIDSSYGWTDYNTSDLVFELYREVEGGDAEELLFTSAFKSPFKRAIQGAT